jgi:hypothetical protein
VGHARQRVKGKVKGGDRVLGPPLLGSRLGRLGWLGSRLTLGRADPSWG